MIPESDVGFLVGNTPHDFHEVSSIEYSLPNVAEAVLTQGGVFVPIKSPDDMELNISLGWDKMPERVLKVLKTLARSKLMTLKEPLRLKPVGYIENLDYSGLEGVVDDDTGDALYQVSVKFSVTRIDWPYWMPEFPAGETFPKDTKYGVNVSGFQPLTFAGETHTQTDSDGYLKVQGGDVDPWGPVMPPGTTESWNRSTRERFYPVHGIQANYLSLQTQALNPVRGSVFVHFKPLPRTETQGENP